MNAATSPPARPLLYTEDDDNDAFLMRHALKRAGVANPLVVASDGQQAIDALSGDRCLAAAARLPALVLLDLNLPVRTGFEVLQWIRAQPRFSELVVVVLSSSNHQKDIDAARALGANDYLVKPSNVEERLRMVRTLQEKWLTGRQTDT